MPRTKQTERQTTKYIRKLFSLPQLFEPNIHVDNIINYSEEKLKNNLNILTERRTTNYYPNLPIVFDICSLLTNNNNNNNDDNIIIGIKRSKDFTSNEPELKKQKTNSLYAFNILPLELWNSIYNFLYIDDKCNFGYSCKSFYSFLEEDNEYWKYIYLETYSHINVPIELITIFDEDEMDFNDNSSPVHLLSDEYLLAYAGRLLPYYNGKQITWKDNLLIRNILEKDYLVKDISSHYEVHGALFAFNKIRLYKISSDYIKLNEEDSQPFLESQFIGYCANTRPIHFLVRISEHPFIEALTIYAKNNNIYPELNFQENPLFPNHPCHFDSWILFQIFIYNHKESKWIELARNTMCGRYQETILEISCIQTTVVDMLCDYPSEVDYNHIYIENLIKILMRACKVSDTVLFYNVAPRRINWQIEYIQNYPHKIKLNGSDTNDSHLRDEKGQW